MQAAAWVPRVSCREPRIADLGGEPARVGGRIRNDGPGTGHAESRQTWYRRDAASLRGRFSRWPGKEEPEPAATVTAMLGEEDARGVSVSYQHRGGRCVADAAGRQTRSA